MTQTLEFTIPELIQKWNLGQIPTDAKVSVTFEDKKPTTKAALAAAQRPSAPTPISPAM